MNNTKVEQAFRRAWAHVTAGKADVPVIVRVDPPTASATTYDLCVTFNPVVDETLIRLTGCGVVNAVAGSAFLLAPTEWVSAPSRILFPDTPVDRLHNLLLDAGVADWVGIRSAENALLEVEFAERPADRQVDALKAKYEIITRDGLTYTFSERTTDVPLGIELPAVNPDPAKVEQRLREAWAGAHGGKIARVEHTDDSRAFIVETVKPVPMIARFRDHGLSQLDVLSPTRTKVYLRDELWEKLLPPAPPVIEPADPPVPPTPPDPEPPAPELDDRDVQIAALEAKLREREATIETLRASIRAITSVETVYMTVVSFVNPALGKIEHGELAKAIREGWTPVYHQYMQMTDGKLNLLTTLKKEPPRPSFAPRYQTVTAHTQRLTPVLGNGRVDPADLLIRSLDGEIEPEINVAVNAMTALVGVMGGA